MPAPRRKSAPKRKPAKTVGKSNASKKMQDELLRKLPDHTDQAQEWGERIATGKAIATSGKSARAKPKRAPKRGRA